MSMKVKTLVCNGKGLDPYRFADMNSLALEIASEFDISYAAVHPQLGAEGGSQVLEDVLRSAEDDSDTYVMVCAGAEDAQTKLFKQAVCDAEFDSKNCLSAEVRERINNSLLERIGERLRKQADSNYPRN
jgi:heterodisulfide reductase subunit A-like polyferredoxin